MCNVLHKFLVISKKKKMLLQVKELWVQVASGDKDRKKKKQTWQII